MDNGHNVESECPSHHELSVRNFYVKQMEMKCDAIPSIQSNYSELNWNPFSGHQPSMMMIVMHAASNGSHRIAERVQKQNELRENA